MSKLKMLQAAMGMEAIDFQNGDFYVALINEIDLIRSRQNVERALLDSALSKIIFDFTGLKTPIGFDHDPSPNAYVYSPAFEPNHPLFSDFRLDNYENMDGLNAIRRSGETLKGTIDIKNGKVGGVYSQYPCPIYLTRGLLQGKFFTNEEVAAILLHEIGHVYSYFEFIGYTYRTTRITAATVAAFFNVITAKEREVVLLEFEKTSGASLEDRVELAKSNNPVLVLTAVLKAHADHRPSLGSDVVYNQRTFEQLADDFSTRQGAGRALAIGLDKMHRACETYEYFPTWLRVVQSISTIMATLFWGVVFGAFTFGVGFFIVIFLAFWGADPNDKIYDDLRDRIGNIRRQLIENLKQSQLSAADKKRILHDIEDIKQIETGIKDSDEILTLLWYYISSTRRKALKAVQLQKELETLNSNDLYYIANKLENRNQNHA